MYGHHLFVPIIPLVCTGSISCHRRQRDHRLENFSGVMIHVCSGISSHFSPKAFWIPWGCGIISRLIYLRYPLDHHIGMSHSHTDLFRQGFIFYATVEFYFFFLNGFFPLTDSLVNLKLQFKSLFHVLDLWWYTTKDFLLLFLFVCLFVCLLNV